MNSVHLVGRIGQDPEIRQTNSQRSVVNLSLATREVWKDRDGGKQERTEWHKLVFWDARAELAFKYVKKGDLIGVDGRLQTRSWTDRKGDRRQTTEVNVMQMHFLTSKNTGEESTDYSQPGQDAATPF